MYEIKLLLQAWKVEAQIHESDASKAHAYARGIAGFNRALAIRQCRDQLRDAIEDVEEEKPVASAVEGLTLAIKALKRDEKETDRVRVWSDVLETLECELDLIRKHHN